jgi:hypothetical protein
VRGDRSGLEQLNEAGERAALRTRTCRSPCCTWRSPSGGACTGLVSVALGHHLEATGVSADLLIQAEITALLAAFGRGPAEGGQLPPARGLFYCRTGRGSRPSDRPVRPPCSPRCRDRAAGRLGPAARVPERCLGVRLTGAGAGGIGVPEVAICRTTWCPAATSWRSAVIPAALCIRSSSRTCPCSARATTRPEAPARAVRPERCR